MNRIERLLQRYRTQAQLPWSTQLSPTERVWIAVYDPADERRLRAALREFELATLQSGRGWHLLDLTGRFAAWMNAHPYRDAYYQEPELLGSALSSFEEVLEAQLREELQQQSSTTVTALSGAGSLFGLLRVSHLLEEVAPACQGRLLLLFPGTAEGNNYRMLNARDGWNYHSVLLQP